MAHSSEKTQAAGLTGPLIALQRDRAGDWHGAHEAAQAGDDRDSAWVHAYLHRKEGDPSNAAYWYRRAGRPIFRGSLEQEWQEIADTLQQSVRQANVAATAPSGRLVR